MYGYSEYNNDISKTEYTDISLENTINEISKNISYQLSTALNPIFKERNDTKLKLFEIPIIKQLINEKNMKDMEILELKNNIESIKNKHYIQINELRNEIKCLNKIINKYNSYDDSNDNIKIKVKENDTKNIQINSEPIYNINENNDINNIILKLHSDFGLSNNVNYLESLNNNNNNDINNYLDIDNEWDKIVNNNNDIKKININNYTNPMLKEDNSNETSDNSSDDSSDEEKNDTESINTNTHPCPKCGVEFYEINGCNQLWCTECKRGFSIFNSNKDNDDSDNDDSDEAMDDLKILWKELIKERNTYKDELYIEPLSIQEQKKMKKNDLVKYQNMRKEYRAQALKEFPLKMSTGGHSSFNTLIRCVCETVFIECYIHSQCLYLEDTEARDAYGAITAEYAKKFSIEPENVDDFFEHMDYIVYTFLPSIRKLTNLLRSYEYAEYCYDQAYVCDSVKENNTIINKEANETVVDAIVVDTNDDEVNDEDEGANESEDDVEETNENESEDESGEDSDDEEVEECWLFGKKYYTTDTLNGIIYEDYEGEVKYNTNGDPCVYGFFKEGKPIKMNK